MGYALPHIPFFHFAYFAYFAVPILRVMRLGAGSGVCTHSTFASNAPAEKQGIAALRAHTCVLRLINRVLPGLHSHRGYWPVPALANRAPLFSNRRPTTNRRPAVRPSWRTRSTPHSQTHALRFHLARGVCSWIQPVNRARHSDETLSALPASPAGARAPDTDVHDR